MNSKASPRGSTIGGMSLVRLSRRGRALLAVVLAVVAGAAAAAQPRSHATDPGVWKPWKGLTAIPSVRADRGLTAAQVKAFETELLVLNSILRRAEGVAAPVGFSVETWGYVSGYRVAEHANGQPPGARVPAAGALHYGSTSDVPSAFVTQHKAKSLARYFRKFAKSPFEIVVVALAAPFIGLALKLRK